MKIMEEVSKILRVYTTPESLDKDIEILEKSGRLDQRKMRELIVMVVKYLNEREKNTAL